MANPVCEVLVTEAQLRAPPIDVDPSAGAAVEFWGIVRGSEDGREIDGIEYEAHREMAEPNYFKPACVDSAFCSGAEFLLALCAHIRAGDFFDRWTDGFYRW